MERMPFADASFDVVYSFGVLHHTDHMDRAVAEIRRVLRPGGQAIIGVYHRDSVSFWLGTVAWRGVLTGGFWHDGWKRTLARIEAGAGDGYVPTVRVLSRSHATSLFRNYQRVQISTHHFSNRLAIWLFGQLRCERFFSRIGWYLVIRAELIPPPEMPVTI